LKPFRFMARALAESFRERAFKLFVFDLIACLQGRIVALEPRDCDPIRSGRWVA